MKGWRVGTLSMGVLLIIVGALLLYGQLSGVSTIELIFNWWPVVLILLGIEVLAYVYLSRSEQPKVKYDGFSIFIIILIIGATLFAYGVKFLFENHPDLKRYTQAPKYTCEIVINAKEC